MEYDIKLIEGYFPGLSVLQKERLGRLYDLYTGWNSKINVVSRKDIEQLYLRHVLHSLAIAKVCDFAPGAKVMDVGTGGGFPGIPLAIMFPEVEFTLVDSIAKKITVVNAVIEALGLENAKGQNDRAENITGKFDYIVSRAVTDMEKFMGFVGKKIARGQKGSLPNGILYLKGGDLAEELGRVGKKYELYEISDIFGEEFFETKKVVYIPIK